MQRLESAELTALAFHEPKRLADERQRAISSASGPASDAEMKRLREKFESFDMTVLDD